MKARNSGESSRVAEQRRRSTHLTRIRTRLPAMSSRRVLKAAEAIREVVSMAILTDLSDPRIEDVTVTYVEVSPDMRQAKVHVSIMGDEAKQQLCLHGCKARPGFCKARSPNGSTRATRRGLRSSSTWA